MNRILHLLQYSSDEHGIRPIADVFAEDGYDDIMTDLYDAASFGSNGDVIARISIDMGDRGCGEVDIVDHLVVYGFIPTDWEAALLIETELEHHYGVVAYVYFTDWNDRIGDMNTLQPTDEDRIAMYNRDIDAYVATFDGGE